MLGALVFLFSAAVTLFDVIARNSSTEIKQIFVSLNTSANAMANATNLTIVHVLKLDSITENPLQLIQQ